MRKVRLIHINGYVVNDEDWELDEESGKLYYGKKVFDFGNPLLYDCLAYFHPANADKWLIAIVDEG